MYRALPVRANPKLRIVSSVLRTYLDVMHVRIHQKDVALGGGRGLPDEDGCPSTPGTPGSHAGSETGSQVRLNGCCKGVSLGG